MKASINREVRKRTKLATEIVNRDVFVMKTEVTYRDLCFEN